MAATRGGFTRSHFHLAHGQTGFKLVAAALSRIWRRPTTANAQRAHRRRQNVPENLPQVALSSEYGHISRHRQIKTSIVSPGSPSPRSPGRAPLSPSGEHRGVPRPNGALLAGRVTRRPELDAPPARRPSHPARLRPPGGLARPLDLLSLGEEEAASLGLAVHLARDLIEVVKPTRTTLMAQEQPRADCGGGLSQVSCC